MVPGALGGDLGAILTPRAAQTLKRRKTVVRWPPLGLLFGALLAHFSGRGRLGAHCSSFFGGYFSRLAFSSILGGLKALKLMLFEGGRHG